MLTLALVQGLVPLLQEVVEERFYSMVSIFPILLVS